MGLPVLDILHHYNELITSTLVSYRCITSDFQLEDINELLIYTYNLYLEQHLEYLNLLHNYNLPIRNIQSWRVSYYTFVLIHALRPLHNIFAQYSVSTKAISQLTWGYPPPPLLKSSLIWTSSVPLFFPVWLKAFVIHEKSVDNDFHLSQTLLHFCLVLQFYFLLLGHALQVLIPPYLSSRPEIESN